MRRCWEPDSILIPYALRSPFRTSSSRPKAVPCGQSGAEGYPLWKESLFFANLMYQWGTLQGRHKRTLASVLIPYLNTQYPILTTCYSRLTSQYSILHSRNANPFVIVSL